jgi:hypothetical protein
MSRACRLSRRRRFAGQNWLERHTNYVQEWEARERVEPTNGAHSVTNECRAYLTWLHKSTRISVHPPLSSIPIDEQDSDDEDPYDVMTRTSVQPLRAPLENYIVRL